MVFKEPEEVKTNKTEEKKVEEKKEVKERIIVVKELPTQQIRKSKDEETGIVTTFITVEEALTSLMGGDL